jgi:pyroglutamyl-peptidase
MPPRLLICGFSAFPEAIRNPAQAAVEALAGLNWSPEGAQADYLTVPVAWRGSAEAILERLAAEPADAVLVVGVAVSASSFHVERLGRNRAAAEKADDLGELWQAEFIAGEGPDELRTIAPTRSMVAAIERLGLAAELSDDAGDYLCNFTYYRLMLVKAAPMVAFLHVPQVREYVEAAAFGLEDVARAVQAAAGAMAEALSLPDAAQRTA